MLPSYSFCLKKGKKRQQLAVIFFFGCIVMKVFLWWYCYKEGDNNLLPSPFSYFSLLEKKR
jgi:hypothetical protein